MVPLCRNRQACKSSVGAVDFSKLNSFFGCYLEVCYQFGTSGVGHLRQRQEKGAISYEKQ
ncbi:hypothetical protein GCM10011297_16840 [Bacterioplanes sanyensis]|nr:hypothetical protein GCM10011297_16840 [Bacterioplanes sanyensis]